MVMLEARLSSCFYEKTSNVWIGQSEGSYVINGSLGPALGDPVCDTMGGTKAKSINWYHYGLFFGVGASFFGRQMLSKTNIL